MTMPDGTIARALAPRTDPPRGRMYDSVLDTVGATPLVRLPRIEAAEGVGPLALKIEFFKRQFDNPANPAIHAATAEELWVDSAGGMAALVAGIGGTLTGIARTLKPRSPDLRIVGVEPAESAVLSGDEAGSHGIGAGFRPAVLDMALLDEIVPVREGHALAAARMCARVEGLPIGISSGAVLHAMLGLARRPALQGRLVAGIAASFAERYLSTDLFAGL